MTGKIHSIETLGAVDGPGVRYTVFFQGCPLRCLFCHNPDTLEFGVGREMSVGEIMADIRRYKSYMRYSGGGVTLTGGEPLMQAAFAAELLKECKKQGIHTAVDTSGTAKLETAAETLESADLVMLSVKAWSDEKFREITGFNVNPAPPLLNELDKRGKKVWIRFALVPGITDDPSELTKIGAFLRNLSNVEKVDVLPFHKMGEVKWEGLGYEYKLKNTRPPTEEEVGRARELLTR